MSSTARATYTTDQDSNIIQSLSRGLAALDLIAGQATTPKGLGEALGVDRSTAYRILQTLSAHGFVERDPLSEQYTLSSRKIFALGSTITSNLHWPTLATPYLKQLRDETGEAVSLAVLQGLEVVYVNHLPGVEAITVGPLLGIRRPVYVSAVGKAIVAFLPETDRETLLAQLVLKPQTPNTITDLQALRDELERVRSLGYAIDDEETFIGVRCIAAPVRDHTGQVVASLGISGPALRLSRERLSGLGARIRDLASAFSTSLGATVSIDPPLARRR